MKGIRTICVVSDWLHGPRDEGIQNLAENLMDQWAKRHSVRALRIGTELSINRLFVGRRMRDTLRDIRPDIVIYLSPSSTKLAALFRARMLKRYAPGAKVFVVAAQPVRYGPVARALAPRLAPDGFLVQSRAAGEALDAAGRPVHFLPSGVDTARFAPVDGARKRALRAKYGENADTFIVLHVGRINPFRNVQVLEGLARSGGARIILVGSTSTSHDEELARRLARAGVRVVREYIPGIEEMYQLADVYLFPVVREDAAIGAPLSVLEAMACNIPVITTPFGGLPRMFAESPGFIYFNNEADLPALIERARNIRECSTRRAVEPFDWERVASAALEAIESGGGAR